MSVAPHSLPALTLDNIRPVLERIVSFINEGVIIASVHGQVLYHNPSTIELLDLPGDNPIDNLHDLNGFNLQAALETLTPRHDFDNHISPFQKISHGFNCSNGARRIEFNTGLISLEDGKTRLRLVLLSDRTEQNQLDSLGQRHNHFGIITNDPAMHEVIARAHQVANVRAPVLLQGESGTGKALFARMIHRLSAHADGPFIEVNCSAIPEALIEVELFGNTKRQGSDALPDYPGQFQAAQGGTLFINEISELPLHLQAKLLRTIQQQRFETTTSGNAVEADVRIITACNTCLRSRVSAGTFRPDLFYRLAVVTLELPPLRQRRGDIILLAQHFIQRFTAAGYPQGLELTPQSRHLLLTYAWPGNVRELENAIEHGMICAVDSKIKPESLPLHLTEAAKPEQGSSHHEHDEREQIIAALRASEGVRSAAAARLGIDRSTLWRKMKKYNLQ